MIGFITDLVIAQNEIIDFEIIPYLYIVNLPIGESLQYEITPKSIDNY